MKYTDYDSSALTFCQLVSQTWLYETMREAFCSNLSWCFTTFQCMERWDYCTLYIVLITLIIWNMLYCQIPWRPFWKMDGIATTWKWLGSHFAIDFYLDKSICAKLHACIINCLIVMILFNIYHKSFFGGHFGSLWTIKLEYWIVLISWDVNEWENIGIGAITLS